MGSRQETVDYLTDQMSGAGEVRARKMFGEYGVYLSGKMAALICDDRLFLKPTEAGATLLPEAETAAPYPGAKPHLVVPEEIWEDADLMAALLARTAGALPAPKPKPKARPRSKKRKTS